MSISLLVQISFLFLFCLALAAMEVQIEAGEGWAKNLPTWRPTQSKWYAKAYGKIMSGKELTGYHLLVFSLVFLFIHYPYFTGKNWDIFSELTTLSLFFIVIVVWDFLWFVINPHYDFMDFWHGKVFWHKKWLLHLPLDYWVSLVISAVLYLIPSFRPALLFEWFLVLALFAVFTLTATVIADLTGVFISRNNIQ